MVKNLWGELIAKEETELYERVATLEANYTHIDESIDELKQRFDSLDNFMRNELEQRLYQKKRDKKDAKEAKRDKISIFSAIFISSTSIIIALAHSFGVF